MQLELNTVRWIWDFKQVGAKCSTLFVLFFFVVMCKDSVNKLYLFSLNYSISVSSAEYPVLDLQVYN